MPKLAQQAHAAAIDATVDEALNRAAPTDHWIDDVDIFLHCVLIPYGLRRQIGVGRLLESFFKLNDRRVLWPYGGGWHGGRRLHGYMSGE